MDILRSIHNWKVAVCHGSRHDGRRFFRSDVDYRDNSSPQQTLRITAITRIAQPELTWKDFSHYSFQYRKPLNRDYERLP